MLESVNLTAYVVLGFALSYLALQGGRHFTVCGISYESKAIFVKACKIGSIGQGMI